MKNRYALFLLALPALFSSCTEPETTGQSSRLSGLWRGVIQLQEQELPFHFRLSGQLPDSLTLTLINGEEQLNAGLVRLEQDTLIMPMHIFDTEVRAALTGTDKLTGYWKKSYEDDFRLPFRASKGETHRFETTDSEPTTDLSGRWAVQFTSESEAGKRYPAVGEFVQKGGQLTGTFLTPSGDYRYLEGNISGNTFSLSAFDGERAFLFKGQAQDSNRLEGTFWSGKGRKERWTARRDSLASLPSADSLTYLKEGYERIEFSFPDLQGKQVSLEDPRYQNKVVILQLFGSWCPNCLDETRFLADWYRRNQQQDVAIIGLAYEKKGDYDYARQRVQTMVEKLNVGYDFLIAGSSDPQEAAKTLPMLNEVGIFPTTLFLDKAHRIRRIHTGFSGPGTGAAYEKWTREFEQLVRELLQEPAPANP
ncbi:TlpA disulfide reductase family protein [Cesiribacter andamanensis]|uniref:Thiol-disulfide oxidoreductase n=1 Tax=Cesiribacter andamanensis AMV16 TaxID=1279009 RepID=M7NP84_9BACT|nr:TlpA disulfide reductase family protein [Cesiribacter andamanensis]EMR03535.1 thiol-disulfide oxidoreductase [Cesiribacter andamanensis AMV16]